MKKYVNNKTKKEYKPTTSNLLYLMLKIYSKIKTVKAVFK